MNDPLPIFDLIINASFLVQVVMGLLAVASVVSWSMIVQRLISLNRAKKDLQEFEDFFWSGTDLTTLYHDLSATNELTGIEAIFVAGFQEFQRLSEQTGVGPDAMMQGVQRATRVAVSREEAQLEKHLGFLATVGSTSPYVGLFGTVWGIMNSFRSLANMSQATLASVAPGISEALIATAMGLFAAIPAVIGFNRFSARAEVLVKSYEAFVDELISILVRAAHEGED